MKSMTGYGKALVQHDGKTATVEMKSVNHRFLEPTFKMPHILNSVEDELRRKLKDSLFRGKIDIYITYQDETAGAFGIVANKPVISAYMEQLKDICSTFGIKFKPDIQTVMELPDAFTKNTVDTSDDEEAAQKIVFEAFDEALSKFIAARETEGKNLETDILFHLQEVENFMAQIEAREPEIDKALREKLKERISNAVAELQGSDKPVVIDPDRFNMEIAYYADRDCIAEETVRMASHIKAMRQEINNGVNIGKKMDFMVQEMNREINTIGSKTSDFDITTFVVAVKSEIEKIREQIQNVE